MSANNNTTTDEAAIRDLWEHLPPFFQRFANRKSECAARINT
jgi:hypothetical protein